MSSLNSESIEVVGSDTAGIITSVSQGLSSIASSIFGPKQVVQQQPTSSNDWIMPVVIGGIGVLGITLIATRSKGRRRR